MATPLSTVRSVVHVDDLGIKTILSDRGISINVDHKINEDEAKILALGYKQELKREFSLWSIFAVSFSVLGLLPSVASTFDYQQLVIGISPVPWIVAVLLSTTVALSLAEIASAFPTSAASAYAVSQLAPKKYAPFCTWITCFSNWMALVTAAPSVDYSCAGMILALYSYNTTSYKPTTGHVYGLTTGIQVTHAIISSLPTKWLALLNSAGTLFNSLGLLVVFIVILAGNKRDELHPGATKFNSSSQAWDLENQTDFPTGFAMLMSFLGVIWAMSGYDSPFVMSEECSNASIAVPRAIVMTAVGGGIFGWIFMFAIAYTLYDIGAISEDVDGLGQPFVLYLTQILDKNLVNLAVALTIIAGYFMGFSCMLTTSRLTYSYSRDGLFPGSRWWKVVNPVTQTPINAVWINFLVGQLLLLLMFAGDLAIGAIFSIGGIGAYVAFTMPTLFKVFYCKDFQRGPWNLGRWSTPIGMISVFFVALMIPVLCFPYVKGSNLTLDEMNWTVLVFFGPLLLFTVWFIVDAHKWYHGPKSNIDEEDMVYNSNVIIGVESEKDCSRMSIKDSN